MPVGNIIVTRASLADNGCNVARRSVRILPPNLPQPYLPPLIRHSQHPRIRRPCNRRNPPQRRRARRPIPKDRATRQMH